MPTQEVLVFVPGFMCDQRVFAPQLAVFSQQYTVVVADITGLDSIETLAESVFSQINQQINCTDDCCPFNLIGFSMGAIIAMAMTKMHPHLIKRLALFDANFREDTVERKLERGKQIIRVRSNRLQQVVTEELKPHYLAPNKRHNRRLLDVLYAMALSLGKKVFVSQSTALLHRKDQSCVLRSVDCPTLILCGEQDELCPPAQHWEMHKMVGKSAIVVIPATGHISTLESPEQVNQAIVAWLQL